MKTLQVWLTFFWIVLGVFVSAYSLRLGIGSALKPGPGLFPLCLGAVIVIIGSCKFVREPPRKGQGEAATAAAGGSLPVARIIALTATLLAYALCLEIAGYIVATFLCMAILLRIGGYRTLGPIVVYALAISLVSYFGFTYLGTTFPPGLFRFLGMH